MHKNRNVLMEIMLNVCSRKALIHIRYFNWPSLAHKAVDQSPAVHLSSMKCHNTW